MTSQVSLLFKFPSIMQHNLLELFPTKKSCKIKRLKLKHDNKPKVISEDLIILRNLLNWKKREELGGTGPVRNHVLVSSFRQPSLSASCSIFACLKLAVADSKYCRLHLILRFWNQTLTCVSFRPRSCAR